MTDHADEKQIPTTTDGEARKPRGNASLWANLLDDQPMALPQVLAGLVREQVNVSIIPTSPTIYFCSEISLAEWLTSLNRMRRQERGLKMIETLR